MIVAYEELSLMPVSVATEVRRSVALFFATCALSYRKTIKTSIVEVEV